MNESGGLLTDRSGHYVYLCKSLLWLPQILANQLVRQMCFIFEGETGLICVSSI